jgi:hypothetical protein
MAVMLATFAALVIVVLVGLIWVQPHFRMLQYLFFLRYPLLLGSMRAIERRFADDPEPVLVVVASSGGGGQVAVWTVARSRPDHGAGVESAFHG